MNKKYEKLCKQVQDIFCISEVLREYCKTRNDDEEIRRILPIVELLYRDADDLNVKMLHMAGIL